MVNEIKMKHYMLEMVSDYFVGRNICYSFYYKDGEIRILKQPKKNKDYGKLILTMPQGEPLEARRVFPQTDLGGYYFYYNSELYTFENLLASIECYIGNHINDSYAMNREEAESFKESLRKVLESIEKEGWEFKFHTWRHRSPSTALAAF